MQRSEPSYAEGDRFEALWYVAVLAGPRPHELRALTWEDVSLERGVAIMRRSVVELKGQPPRIRNSTKTGKGRSVPLLPEVVWALEAHRERQYDERLEFRGLWQDEGLVFPNSRGSPMARANLTNRHYKPLLRKAGLPKETRLYDLRHTFAASGQGHHLRASESGSNTRGRSDLYGHAGCDGL